MLTLDVPKGDELPVRVHLTGGSGPARVWGHVKSSYSAGEMTEGPRVYRIMNQHDTVVPPSRLNIVLPWSMGWLASGIKWYVGDSPHLSKMATVGIL